MQSPSSAPVCLLDEPWQYRGEGGANLVISLTERRRVVRFAKTKYADKDQDAKVGEIAHFANEVIRPLLGAHFVRPLSLGFVDGQNFDHVRLAAGQFRPLRRCKKNINSGRVILSPDCVFLAPEYEANTGGDTLCFEIKPKQGWHSLKSLGVDLCHRCLKQHARVCSGDWDGASPYCPLDLFSGDKQRVKRALFDLFETPSNRFKVFKNGRLVYSDGVGSLDGLEREMATYLLGAEAPAQSPLAYLASLLATALLSPMDPCRGYVDVMEDIIGLDAPAAPCAKKSCDTRGQPLPKGSILQRVLALQKGSDLTEREAQQICDRLLGSIDDIEALHRLVLGHPHVTLEYQLTPSELDDVAQLQRFLLSMTAKDVSLLLTFREVEDAAAEEELEAPCLRFRSLGGKCFRPMISVIDLDPKPVRRIAAWVERMDEWLKTYFGSLEGGRPVN